MMGARRNWWKLLLPLGASGKKEGADVGNTKEYWGIKSAGGETIHNPEKEKIRLCPEPLNIERARAGGRSESTKHRAGENEQNV